MVYLLVPDRPATKKIILANIAQRTYFAPARRRDRARLPDGTRPTRSGVYTARLAAGLHAAAPMPAPLSGF